MQRKPDISLAKEKLTGWNPDVELRDGLEKTINYFDSLLQEKSIKALVEG